jgi:hypothetical protein
MFDSLSQWKHMHVTFMTCITRLANDSASPLIHSDGTMTSSLLLHRTSLVAIALLNYRIIVKTCVLCCLCFVDWRDFCCSVSIFSVVVFAALVVRFCSMMYVILAAFDLGFGALLYNHIDSLPIWLIYLFFRFWSSGSVPLF